jgi:RNA polymerase sigma-70 factor (ECF subfamily)
VDPALTRTIELVRAAQGGDRQALDRLITRYYERVRRIVRVRLGARLRGRLESGDILQEVFIDVLRSLDQYEQRDEAGFLAWLARIAEHRIRDAADFHGTLKRNSEREQPLVAEDSVGGPLPLETAAPAPRPPEQAERAEQVARLEECLSDLPEADRELVVLRDYIGLSWADVALQTGRASPDAARMRHASVLVELGRRMNGSGPR